MKLDGRRQSSNVEDRRGKGLSKGKTVGIGGIILGALVIWLLGGNPMSFLATQMTEGITSTQQETYTPTAEDEEMVVFAKRILAGTEDVWTKIFKQNGMEYAPPKMVIFNGVVQSGCGTANSQTGPFYCPADQTVYIDLSFFNEMEKKLKAGGDFAYAYVIAHEVGHHVQYLLGTLNEVQKQQQKLNQRESNRLNVRLELQADFFAGIWGHFDNKMFNSIEDGDIEEGLNAASQIGDDRLQMQSQGYTVPDAFNHGTSEQRSRWLKKGLQTGDVSLSDTFSIDYDKL